MGPKKPGKELDDDAWRKTIEAMPLDDLFWRVKVIMIDSAGSDQDRIYLSKFEAFAAEERRFVIKNISKTETLFMINQLGGEKKVKDDSLRVFEEAQLFLKDKKDVPSDLMAVTIKHLIIKMKDEYLFIKRQRLQVKEGLTRESATMFDRAEVRGTVSVKPPPEPEPEKPKKGKKEIETPTFANEPEEGKKYNTQLRVRGEEWRDKVYVDDFPTDGPNIYVAITGFQDPYLPGSLVKVGIPLTGVVQIRIEGTNIKVPSSLSRPTKRGQSQTEILMEKSLKFWEDLQSLRIQRDTRDDLKNTAFVIFSPPYWDQNNLSGNAEKIYDELCYLMYDIQDLSRQHVNYLNNLDVIQIPIDTLLPNYTTKYNDFMEDMPLESVTSFSVLDSILQSVCKNDESENDTQSSLLSDAMFNNEPKNVKSSVKNNEKVEKAENLVKDIFRKLTDATKDSNKNSYRPTYGEEFENHIDPTILNYGDFSKNTTFHLGNINLDNLVYSMLRNIPVHQIWQKLVIPKREIESKINYHVTVLLSCFERQDVETSELTRLLHTLACRKLYNNRSSNQKQFLPQTTNTEFKKVYLKRSILAEPLPKSPSIFYSSASMSLSFPSMTKIEEDYIHSYTSESNSERMQFLFDCPDISELVSAAEIHTNKPIGHMIDDYQYFEDFSGISSFQMLQEVFNNYNCVDYKYCEVTNSIVLMFFNSHDKDGISRVEWRNHLPTPLCLQDFFDFVFEENYEWIIDQEKMYESKMEFLRQSECKDIVDVFATTSCTDNQEPCNDLLMEGSLKHIQMLDSLEDQATDPPETKLSSKRSSPSDSDSKLTKKGKTPPSSSTPRSAKHTLTPTSDGYFVIKKPFSGYDLGDRRVEILGKDTFYYSKDDSVIWTEFFMIIPTNIEFVSLNIAPGNGKNVFRIHRSLGDFIESKYVEASHSFRITCKDNVMININKESYQIPLPSPSTSTPVVKENKVKSNVDFKSDLFIKPTLATKFYHKLFITWPNGLIIESVHENDSPEISHIKQFYVSEGSNLGEDMRCISRNGEVIIFKKSGDIEILKSDGTYILVTKCEKRVIVSELSDNLSTVSSGASTEKVKSQKGKESVKSKEKPSRSSSKNSKSDLSGSKLDIKPPKYELFIEEYEIIETSGLRQKFSNGVFTDIEKLLIRTATDYVLHEIFSRRMDGTNILLNKDGVQIVTFHDKTRIITTVTVENNEIYPEWTDEEREYLDICYSERTDNDTMKGSVSQKSYYSNNSFSKKIEEENENSVIFDEGYVSVLITYTVEHPNFATIVMDPETGVISVCSPNNTTVNVQNGNFDIKLDEVTKATFDGKKLHVDYEACSQCSSRTKCDVTICKDDDETVPIEDIEKEKCWLKMKDSYSKCIMINEEGNINVVENFDDEVQNSEFHKTDENDDIITQDGKSEASFIGHGQCRASDMHKKLRFFVLRSDLTSTELIHRSLVEEYKTTCRWQPWCSINEYEAFGDHRKILSILSPIHLNECEKWLMDSTLADKPQYLTFKDLKKDEGKGFYHWMRPYGRFEPTPMKPANVLPPRLPRAFVLRTLEQQWDDETRESMKGAKQLLEAILKYRTIMESDCLDLLNIPIIDSRSVYEIQRDRNLHQIAHRMYTELKNKLDEDVYSRMKRGITTKAVLYSDQVSLGILTEEESIDEAKVLEERKSQVEEVQEVDTMSPNLKRYWKIRAEESKEEQFYKYLLRQGNIPPYFRNVLGGAIWWEVMNAAGGAVNIAENYIDECPCESCPQRDC